MIAHIVYNKIDKEIACCSKEIIKKITQILKKFKKNLRNLKLNALVSTFVKKNIWVSNLSLN